MFQSNSSHVFDPWDVLNVMIFVALEQLAPLLKTMITYQEKMTAIQERMIAYQQQHNNKAVDKAAKRFAVTEYVVVTSQACSIRAPEVDIVLEWLQLPLEIPFTARVTDMAFDDGPYPGFAAFDWTDRADEGVLDIMRLNIENRCRWSGSV